MVMTSSYTDNQWNYQIQCAPQPDPPQWIKGSIVLGPNRYPHKCPVCGGKGIVPHGFYDMYPTHQGSTTAPAPAEKCRSCWNGIIWG